jgi:hypothetical protein
MSWRLWLTVLVALVAAPAVALCGHRHGKLVSIKSGVRNGVLVQTREVRFDGAHDKGSRRHAQTGVRPPANSER